MQGGSESGNVPQISLNTVSQPISVQSKVAEQREFARQFIAVLIVGSLFLIVILSFISLWLKNDGMLISDITGIMDKLISPVAGIVGAVTGFYFGERRGEATAQATTTAE